MWRKRELKRRLPHDIVRRRRQRRPGRSPQHVPRSVLPLEQEGEVRAAALADPVRLQRACSQSVLVEERADGFQDQQRRARCIVCVGAPLDDVHAQNPDTSIAAVTLG